MAGDAPKDTEKQNCCQRECSDVCELMGAVMKYEHPLIAMILYDPVGFYPSGAGDQNFDRIERIFFIFTELCFCIMFNFVLAFGWTAESTSGQVFAMFVSSCLYCVAHMFLVYPVAYILKCTPNRDAGCGYRLCAAALYAYGLVLAGFCLWVSFDLTAVYDCGDWGGCKTTLWVEGSCQPAGCDSFEESDYLYRNKFADQHRRIHKFGMDFGWTCRTIKEGNPDYPAASGDKPSENTLLPIATPMPCNTSTTVCGTGNSAPLTGGSWGSGSCTFGTEYCRCITNYHNVGRLIVYSFISYFIITWWVSLPSMLFTMHYIIGKCPCNFNTPLYEYVFNYDGTGRSRRKIEQERAAAEAQQAAEAQPQQDAQDGQMAAKPPDAGTEPYAGPPAQQPPGPPGPPAQQPPGPPGPPPGPGPAVYNAPPPQQQGPGPANPYAQKPAAAAPYNPYT